MESSFEVPDLNVKGRQTVINYQEGLQTLHDQVASPLT